MNYTIKKVITSKKLRKEILESLDEREEKLANIMSVFAILLERNSLEEEDRNDLITLFGKKPLSALEVLKDKDIIVTPYKLALANKRIKQLEQELSKLKQSSDLSKLMKLISHSYRSMILKPSPFSENKNRILKIQTSGELNGQFDLLNKLEHCDVYPDKHPKLIKLDIETIEYLNRLNTKDIRMEQEFDEDGDINQNILALNENDVYGLELDYIKGKTLTKIVEENENNEKNLKILFDKLLDFVRDVVSIYERTGLVTDDISEDNIIVDDEFIFHSIDVGKRDEFHSTNIYPIILLSGFVLFLPFECFNSIKIDYESTRQKLSNKENLLEYKKLFDDFIFRTRENISTM